MVTPGTKLGPYEIVALLGTGGMGEVYRARDTRLGRDVAIKVLPAEFAADAERLKRFEREAKATAALSHPNILDVHDVGTHEGVPYLVEELLEGESLRERLARGAVPAREAVEIAVQVAHGLAAAHGKHIVHRDLKPANVFITREGIVKILDFGIAKLVEGVPLGEADTLTHAPTGATDLGRVLGTMAYMAPEQARGMPVDPRSDIFSFGVVLYEMLSGERPFRGETATDTVAAILKEDPPPLPEGVPPALQGVVTQCLAKRPDQRFSSAHDLALALRAFSGGGDTPAGLPPGARTRVRRWLPALGVAVAVVAAAVAVWQWKGRSAAPASRAGPKRIAVLPFENLGAPEDAYFADGMTDEVRGKLAALGGLAVIARSSSDQYRATAKPPRQISEELATPFLLTAKVRWQKGGTGTSRIRVTPELVEVSDAGAPTTRWQDSFDADLQDVFRVQSEIATRVAGALEVALGARDKARLAGRPTANLAAYDAFLRGQKILERGFHLPDLRRAAEQFEQAVTLDPSFGLAWAQLSTARSLEYAQGGTRALSEKAREAAERAVQLAPELAEARLAMGNYHNYVRQSVVPAREEFSAGLSTNPRHAGLLRELVRCDESMGYYENAVSQLELARSLDPRSVNTESLLGQTLLALRRYPEALAALDRALALNPASLSNVQYKAMVFLAQGDLAGARAVANAGSKQVDPVTVVAFFANYNDLGWVLDEAQQQLLFRLTPADFDGNVCTWAMAIAQTHAYRGEMAQARQYAEKAHTAYLSLIARDPDHGIHRANHGVVLAYLGRREEAVREGERAATLSPLFRSWNGRYIQILRAQIFIILGEQEKALNILEPYLRMPTIRTPAWLSIDPAFAPLRGNPRFEKLLKSEGWTR